MTLSVTVTSSNLPLHGTSSQLPDEASSGWKASPKLIQASGNVQDMDFADCFLSAYVGSLLLGLYTSVKNELKPSELNIP